MLVVSIASSYTTEMYYLTNLVIGLTWSARFHAYEHLIGLHSLFSHYLYTVHFTVNVLDDQWPIIWLFVISGKY